MGEDMQTELKERIDMVLDARAAAATALADAFRSDGVMSSERTICDRWLNNIASNKELNSEGWYQPPPGGSCVLIGHPEDEFARLNYDSIRDPAIWSRDDIYQREDSILYVYASPIVRGTGLIGDIGLTLYRGENTEIRDHLVKCLEVTVRIARFAEVGMPLRDLFNFAKREMENAQLSNETSSSGSGIENIGHTVPWSYEPYSDEAKLCLHSGSAEDVRNLISDQRVSVNDLATLQIQPTMAFTVEPQISSPIAPLCSYHMIVAFSDGAKTIIPSFKSLFEDFSMSEYMAPVLDELSLR